MTDSLVINPYRFSGVFNPWDAAYPTPIDAGWAGDPLGSWPADGGAVTTWRNQSGGGDPTQATAGAKPTYRAATVWGTQTRPSVQFDGGDILLSNKADQAQPYKLILVYKYTSVAAAARIFGFGGNNVARGYGIGASAVRRVQNTAAATGGTEDTNAHIAVITVNGASTAWTVDGVADGSGDSGTGSWTWLALGGGTDNTPTPGNQAQVHLGYWGGYASGASTGALEAALRTDYGI